MDDDSAAVSQLFYVLALGMFAVFAIELLRYGLDYPSFVQGVAGVVFAMVGTWFEWRPAAQARE